VRKLALCSLMLLCLGTAQALALSDKPYLAASDADFGDLLPPPPADGSPLDKRDMQGVLDLQKQLTPARLEQIQADLQQSVYQVAGKVLGPTFTKDKFPRYKRMRPFQANKEVQAPENIARAAQSPTYPSGHSTFGAEVALLLAMMVPEKTAELHARGWEYGEQRIASGVAYPTDWETAHIGATLMVALMMQKPEFRADFQAVKTEVRKGLGLAP
jgi:acid phosphatase (class A)